MTTSNRPRPRYPSLMGGRPSKIPLSGLFLLSPEFEIKLFGSSMRALFKQRGKESLYKRLEKLKSSGGQPSPELIADVRSLIPEMPPSPYVTNLCAALDGDSAAQCQIDRTGAWEAFREGGGFVGSAKLDWMDFFVDVEHECMPAWRCVLDNRFADAAAALKSSSLMRHFLWPEAVSALRRVTHQNHVMLVQLSVMMEMRLSQVACTDACCICSPADSGASKFSFLLPAESNPKRTPARELFAWTKKAAGVRTIASLVERLAERRGPTLDVATVKRWSNGSHFPSDAMYLSVVKRLVPVEKHKDAAACYGAARRLSFLGWLAEMMTTKTARAAKIAGEAAVAPWPRLPFGYPTFEAWCTHRYPVWFEFHRKRQAKVRG